MPAFKSVLGHSCGRKSDILCGYIICSQAALGRARALPNILVHCDYDAGRFGCSGRPSKFPLTRGDRYFVILCNMGLFPTLLTYMLLPMNNNAPKGQPPKALIAAVLRILRPLVRGFIGLGLTFPILSDLLKRVYVDIAREDFRIDLDKSPTDSRITLLTRVHRKDVKKFREEISAPPLNLASSSIAAQIIAHWLGSPNFVDPQGKPKPLARTGPHSFDALARGTSKDMHPRAILDELLRSSTVWVENDIVHLDTKAFIPRKDFEELAYYFGLNLHDHIAASTHNLTGNPSPFLDRSVHYSGLSPASVKLLKAQAKDLGMKTLLTLNAHAKKLATKDGDQENGQRMTFGVYFYDAPDEEGGHDE